MSAIIYQDLNLHNLSCNILKWTCFNVVAATLLVAFFLLYRYIVLNFGRRIKPDGEKGILITGATSGIGLSVAKHLYKLGFSIFAAYYNELEVGYKELLELDDKRNLNRLFLVKLDVTSQDSIQRAYESIDKLSSEYNIKLICLINNAGIGKVGPFEWSFIKSIRDVLDTNLAGLMMVTRQFILRIVQNKGRVINVGSGLCQVPGSTFSVYGSTKSGVAYFSESLNQDLKIYGASCHCILPGNLIANSNIIYASVSGLQESERRLNEQERRTYRQSIDSCLANNYGALRLILETELDPQQVAKRYKFEIPHFKKRTTQAKRKPWLKSSLIRMAAIIDGQVRDLQNSSVPDTFEQAVCLKSPTRRLYAGNLFFTYISGPMLELAPPLYCNFLGQVLTSIVSSRKVAK